jgi:hypothetical protein
MGSTLALQVLFEGSCSWLPQSVFTLQSTSDTDPLPYFL